MAGVLGARRHAPANMLLKEHVRGAATCYSDELTDKICELLIDGVSLTTICRMEGMPRKNTVLRWLHMYEDWHRKYYLARQLQVEGYADDLLELSDDSRNDYMEVIRRNGEVEHVFDHEHVNRTRLRIETRKYLMARLMPHVYGERVEHNHGGAVTARLVIEDRPPDPKLIEGSTTDVT